MTFQTFGLSGPVFNSADPQSSFDLKNLPKWDLSDFYQSTDDPKLAQDLEMLEEKVQSFITLQGTINATLPSLFEHIQRYEDIVKGYGNIASYAYLNYATQMVDEKAQAFMQRVQEIDAEVSANILFFTLEIIALEDTDIAQAHKNDPRLGTYKVWLDQVRRYKPHTLSVEEEKILAQKDLTSHAAWVRLYDQTLAEIEVTDSRNNVLNLSEILERMSHKDGALRKEAAELLNQTLLARKTLFNLVTNTLLKDKSTQDNLRHYSAPWASRHMANVIEEGVVDALVSAVKNAYPLCHRYYAWKAKEMGQTSLPYWDRNAPLPHSTDEDIGWDEAKDIVYNAYKNFSPKMADVGKKFFDHNWIDVPAYKGKTSGAFAHPTTPDVHPYLMLNYLGKRRDVMTLAHELGHGVHQYLSNAQPYLLTNTPLTVAETASVFGEMLTFRSLLERCNTPLEKKHLLAGKIEDMINTVFRQISFHDFEVQLHTARKKGEISFDAICDMWQASQKEALGESVTCCDLMRPFWGYISHFIHVPFYVYAYAFGDCLVNSLYGTYTSKTVEDFEEKYMHMLSLGGSQPYDQLMQPFGLDLKDPAFWQGGIQVIENLMTELEALED